MLTRLRLSFSHLREHKFRHGFKDTLNPVVPIVLKPKLQHTISCTATPIIQTKPPFPFPFL